MISLGASDARRIGLDFNRGQKGMTQTANGQSVVSKIQLDTVRIGDVTLHNVDALIHQTEMPMALLGMSFLNRQYHDAQETVLGERNATTRSGNCHASA